MYFVHFANLKYMELTDFVLLFGDVHPYGPYAIQSRDTYLELEPSLSLA